MKLLVLLLIFSFHSLAKDLTACNDEESMAILFLNGVQNSESQADISLLRIKKLLERDSRATDIYQSGIEALCFKKLFNKTNEYRDFIETIAQKIREEKENKNEIFSYEDVAQWIFDKKEFLQKYIDDEDFSSAINMTEEIFLAEMNTQIGMTQNEEDNTLLEVTGPILTAELKERSVLVVSHSQGNLFANLLFTRISQDPSLASRLDYFANLQVGSAASYVGARDRNEKYGDWMTGSLDLIITGLNDYLGFVINPPNIEYNYPSILLAAGPLLSQKAINTINQARLDKPDLDPLSPVEEVKVVFGVYGDLVQGHSFTNIYTSDIVQGKLEGGAYARMSEIFLQKLIPLAQNIVEEIPTQQFTLNSSNPRFVGDKISMNYSLQSSNPELIPNITSVQIDEGTGVFRDYQYFEDGVFTLPLDGTNHFAVKIQTKNSGEFILSHTYSIPGYIMDVRGVNFTVNSEYYVTQPADDVVYSDIRWNFELDNITVVNQSVVETKSLNQFYNVTLRLIKDGNIALYQTRKFGSAQLELVDDKYSGSCGMGYLFKKPGSNIDDGYLFVSSDSKYDYNINTFGDNSKVDICNSSLI
jgi:hypothetical protein